MCKWQAAWRCGQPPRNDTTPAERRRLAVDDARRLHDEVEADAHDASGARRRLADSDQCSYFASGSETYDVTLTDYLSIPVKFHVRSRLEHVACPARRAGWE